MDEHQFLFETENGFFRMGGFADSEPDREGLSFVDPSGGPFIGVGASLNEYHRELPDRKIIKIHHKHDTGIIIEID